MSTISRTSLVTGASAGIGAAFAHALASRGHDLVLTARRTDRLKALAKELQERHAVSVTVLPADLADPDAAPTLVSALQQRDIAVDWLINNAGYGVPGRFEAADWTVHADFLRVLIEAPTELAWRLLPGMQRRGYGRIINVASLAGHVPGSLGHTLYSASKAYMIKFSQSLALENSGRDVHACALCPGFTYSEFHDVTGTRDLMKKLPRFMWQTAEAVVEEGIAAVDKGTPVWITGRVNRLVKRLVQLMPDPIALKMSKAQSRRFRHSK